MAKAPRELVIVESPAKARTIEKYLGTDYRVVASMGHLRDLPKSRLGVDIEHGFQPDYEPVKEKKPLIEELRKYSKSADTVFLATDPDREGEAISWHLKELLELPDEKARRVTFNEITKNVVRSSIQAPRDIDMDLVDAQQARRILDRIVGYKLSPLLWRKIKPKLSAGRVQSVATRMVVDREQEIRAFQPEEYWLLDVELRREDPAGGGYTARYYGSGGKKRELRSQEEVAAVTAEIEKSPFVIDSVKRGEKQRSPSPPFITSTLQQEASRRLGMTPRRTMSIAQQLYEGVDIQGVGTVGLITYMRTDSLRLSEDALSAAASFIRGRYGEAYYPGKPRRFKTKAGAQDAHEAIRPSSVELTPEMVKSSLTGEQYRLYRLIWGRFTASQMSNAVYDNVVIDTVSAGHVFRANHSELKFPGYTAVYEESREEESEERRRPLPDLREGEQVRLEKTSSEQRFTQPPARYTEATLIRAMEENGIGRPSTYAPTISTITSKEYVVKEGKYLRPTALGEVVTKLMEERFADIVDLKFTAWMESALDGVEEGKKDWHQLLAEFYKDFSRNLEDAEKALEGEHIKVPDEFSDEYCDLCGRRLVYKTGRFGRFLACPGFPECSFTKPIVIEMPGRCPACGGRILKRTSQKGNVYYACEKGKDCPWRGTSPDGKEIVGFMTWDVPVKETCPDCGKTMFKLSGKGARKPFCINPECPSFVPEDQRGYKKRRAAPAKAGTTPAGEAAAEPEPKAAKAAKAPTKAAARPTAKTARATAKTAAKSTARTAKTAKAKSAKTAGTAQKAAGEN